MTLSQLPSPCIFVSGQIWTSDFVSFKGVLLNFTRRYDEDVMYNDRKLISEQITLDAATAQRVYKLFADNHIFNMPSQEGIPGWSMGNDGETFVVEYVTPSSYSFKEYWTPSYFKDIKEAVVFNKTVDALEAMLGMRNSWDDFVYSLPKGYYTCGDRIVYVTKAKKEMMQRERRKEKERRPIDFNDCSALSVIMNDTLIRNFLISRIGSIEKCVFKKSYRSRELNIVCKSLVFDNRNYQIFDSSEMLVLNSQPEQVVEIGVTALEKRVYHIFLTANGNGAEFEITYSSKGYEISLWGIDPLIVVNKAYKAK